MKVNIKRNVKSSGFTIVELLVVIVVIGILAAITIVTYAGISRKATISALQSDLANGAGVN
jgi:prepilin-type N-terminal cleavage/methylation domain-containing protein